ncbi:MAG TPA: Zn-dependent alcohol dehydrogenase, partial [bacterium]|nr:Zn-dependent alcohol dehydrogenase [bacterium]
QAEEVLVRMAAGGVCHTDLHVMTGHLFAPLPAVLGHEGAGTVAEVGPGVESVRPGDHVIPLWRLSCGECEYCTGGRPALCPAGTEIRMTGRLPDGTTRFALGDQEIKHFAGVSSFSEFSVIPEKALIRIPDDLPLDRAALFGCAVICGVGAVLNAARVRPGSSVAVFGAGGVGLNVIQGAALAGAGKIIAVDLLEGKLEYARRFGATHTVNASSGNPVEQVRALTGGRGVDYAFEAIGVPAVMRQAYDTLAKRGMAVVIGVTPMTAEVSVPVMSLVFEERTLSGSVYGASRPRIDIPMLIDLYRAGKLKVDELLTRTYPFDQINEAYAALERGEVARTVVTF